MGVAADADVTHACARDARVYAALRFSAVEAVARLWLTRADMPKAQQAVEEAAGVVRAYPRLLTDKRGHVAVLQGMYAMTAGDGAAAAKHLRRAVALLEAAPGAAAAAGGAASGALPRRRGRDPLLNAARRETHRGT